MVNFNPMEQDYIVSWQSDLVNTNEIVLVITGTKKNYIKGRRLTFCGTMHCDDANPSWCMPYSAPPTRHCQYTRPESQRPSSSRTPADIRTVTFCPRRTSPGQRSHYERRSRWPAATDTSSFLIINKICPNIYKTKIVFLSLMFTLWSDGQDSSRRQRI